MNGFGKFGEETGSSHSDLSQTIEGAITDVIGILFDDIFLDIPYITAEKVKETLSLSRTPLHTPTGSQPTAAQLLFPPPSCLVSRSTVSQSPPLPHHKIHICRSSSHPRSQRTGQPTPEFVLRSPVEVQTVCCTLE